MTDSEHAGHDREDGELEDGEIDDAGFEETQEQEGEAGHKGWGGGRVEDVMVEAEVRVFPRRGCQPKNVSKF